ncbi:hypothetical protein BJV77DRAFT_988224, partial [Russula vinacea]
MLTEIHSRRKRTHDGAYKLSRTHSQAQRGVTALPQDPTAVRTILDASSPARIVTYITI